LAWRRQSVADLNRITRHVARDRGWLTGPDMQPSDGRELAVSDIVVTLAPDYRGALVTSERARVTAIDPEAGPLTIRTDHGRQVTLLGSSGCRMGSRCWPTSGMAGSGACRGASVCAGRSWSAGL
jgi:hypothetical protein